jgi:high-affinity nickel-transport protein
MMQALDGSWWATLGLAFLLGVRHGFDPDHLAVIDNLTRRNIRRPDGAARYAGVLFSLGHGALVIAVALAAALSAARWQAPAWLEISGTAVSVAFLLGLAILNLAALLRTPADQLVELRGLKSRMSGRLVAVRSPLAIAGVGMLFALSFDTISQALLFAVLAAKFGAVWGTLAAAMAFVAGMLAMDGLNGLVIAGLIRRADRISRIASRVMTAAVAAVSLGVGGLILAERVSPAAAAWSEASGLLVGALVMAAIGLAFAGAFWVARGRENPAG